MQPLMAAFDSHWEPLVWFALGVLGAVGIMAALDPRRVTTLLWREHGWVETAKGVGGAGEPAGSRFFALALGRLFGVAVLAAVGAIAYFLAQR